MSAASCTLPLSGRTVGDDPVAAQRTRRRILVVDDDAGVLFALRRLFGTIDVDVETCVDPEEAVRRLEEEGASYDLVISDQRMPKMSGLEMLRRVRATLPATPTILMTGFGDSGALEQAYESCGVFRYLTKPWDNFDLLVTVKEALRAAAALER
jgi:DNA-binding NtrC family response regulator